MPDVGVSGVDARLRAVVNGLLGRAPARCLDRASLANLLFMVDYEHFLTFGEPITGLTWRFEESGPFAPEVPDCDGPPPETDQGEEAASALMHEERVTVRRIAEKWAGAPSTDVLQWLRGDEFLRQFEGGQRIDFSKFEDPLDDPAVQERVMRNTDLHESVNRAEAQMRTRGGQREGIAR